MTRRCRRALATVVSALCAPAAIGLGQLPAADAATVLAVEGTLQMPGTTQKAFQGSFCAENTCRSVNFAPGIGDAWSGSWLLQAAVSIVPGDLIIMGYSLGASSIHDRLRFWEMFPALAPDPARVVLVVTFGNPENRFGGQARDFIGSGLPDSVPFKHLDVTMQYDPVADRPTRLGLFSSLNLAFAQHVAYFDDIDINDPDNLVYQADDGTTYMLVRSEVLPLVSWMDWFTPDERMAELDAILRPLVERDYDRPAYVEQGEGADWGNGNPPPSLPTTGEGSQAAVRAEATRDLDEDADEVSAVAGPASEEPASAPGDGLPAPDAEEPAGDDIDADTDLSEVEQPEDEGAGADPELVSEPVDDAEDSSDDAGDEGEDEAETESPEGTTSESPEGATSDGAEGAAA
ncbi:PE-PPE domain-containing protein [Mycolicibacterium austroafricanum]|nr:PE-PPE domain-containing protein [Mycolicibacterium austroafricanum]